MQEQSDASRLAVVAAGDPHTAAAGVEILERGGNAVDAAVAATFAACVAEPVLTGPFGGGFATVGRTGTAALTYDFFARVPGHNLPPAEAGDGLDFRAVEVSFGPTTQVFHVGRGAAAVPLLLPGLLRLQSDHGRLSLPQVTEPAIRLARAGVPLSSEVAPILRVLEPILRLSASAEHLFAPHGNLLGAGELFANPELAELFASLDVSTVNRAQAKLVTTFGPPNGRIMPEDLELAAPTCQPSLRVTLAAYQVDLNPPPSSGGILIAFGLRLLEGMPAATWRDEASLLCHLLAAMDVTVQARRAALARGASGLGEAFLSDSWLERWREPFAQSVRRGPEPSAAPEPPLGSTTHVSCVDADGTACAITSSNGEGCGYVVPGTGALANNFLGEEDLHPGGFHRGAAGEQLSSMMCPAVVLKEGKPHLALGTGGSNRIRTAILQVLARHLFAGEPIEQAVRAPRLHYEGGPVYVEKHGPGTSLATSAFDAIASRARKLVVFDTPNIFFGGVHAAGALGHGAGDPRRGGAVAAVRLDTPGAGG